MESTRSNFALFVRDLRKSYKDVVAVDGLSFEVERGECFGLLGPNGAGKTTTIEMCEGLTVADSGELQLLNLNWRTNAPELRERLGIQVQETQLSEKLTVFETLRLFRSFYRRGKTPNELMALTGLEEKRDARIGNLSGGQKQRLALACAMAGDPEFLFLDEPATGLDPQARRQLWELIEGLKLAGRTILLTTHFMDEAERLCDRLAIMDHGKVIALGTPSGLIQSLGAEHIVEFAIDRSAGSFNVESLRDVEGVRDVCAADGQVQLRVGRLHESVPPLLAELARKNIPLTELRTHSATLEDVFVSLTGRQLRDE